MYFTWKVSEFPGYCVWDSMAHEHWLMETLCVFWIPAALSLFVTVTLSIHYAATRKKDEYTYPTPIMAYSCTNENVDLTMFGLHRSAACGEHNTRLTATSASDQADKLDKIILALGMTFSFMACMGPYAFGMLRAHYRGMLYIIPHGVKFHKMMITTLLKPLLDALVLLTCWRPYREKVFGRHCGCRKRFGGRSSTVVVTKF
ncbi:uncharacterized protein LOC129594330 isoform X2 [Paramacrobiotus metropolitanus]|nr:uncharacterized protein LOC129594330 isoform X2 [Paramacrobiotus metropolitanus]